MTTHAAPMTGPSTRRSAAWPALAAIAVGYEAMLTAIGTFVDTNGKDNGHHSIGDYLTSLGIVAFAAALVFGLVVRTTTVDNAGRRGLALAILAVPATLVFWTGTPCLLAVGSIACVALARSGSGRLSTSGIASLVMSALAIVFGTYFAFVG